MYFAPIPCTHPKEVPSRELPKGDLGSPGGISLRNGHRTTIKPKKNFGRNFPVPLNMASSGLDYNVGIIQLNPT